MPKHNMGIGRGRAQILRLLTFTIVVLLGLLPGLEKTADAAEFLLWEATDAALVTPHLPTTSLPSQARALQALTIAASVIQQLETGDRLRLSLPGAQQTRFEVSATSSFPNGDTSWQAENRDRGDLYTLSLTRGAGGLLASLYTPTGKYFVQANYVPSQGHYLGWLFDYERARYQRADNQGHIPLSTQAGDQVALSSSEVTISQTLSHEYAMVGQQLDVEVRITNHLGSPFTNIPVNILFVAEHTRFLGSDSGCLLGSTGAQPSIQCTINSLASGMTATLNYSVLLIEQSYPQVVSSVFVGNLFSADYVRDDVFVFVSQDTLTDSDGDQVSDFDERLVGSNPDNAGSAPNPDSFSEVDLLFLYTDDFAAELPTGMAQTRINQMLATTNSYFANSGARIRFRPVYYKRVNYELKDLETAMQTLATGQGAFVDVDSLRTLLGADIVVLIGGMIGNDDFCGLGQTPGVGFNGELFHPRIADPELYSVLYMDGFPEQGGFGCSDDTLAHELGHNFGLAHSRRSQGTGGTYNWSHGYGVDGAFTTIMAYSSNFTGSQAVPLFSNPASNDCLGMPCGFTRTDLEQGADAVHSLNQTRRQVARRHQSRLIEVAELNNRPTGLIMYGGATRSGELVNRSAFTPSESIDVRARLAIPDAHQGKTGETYVVIMVEDLGLFYRDASGAYRSWNGTLETLQSSISSRALKAEEELVAFEQFVPAAFAVSNATVTVFFAYSVNSREEFIYSVFGVPFRIQ